MFSQLCRVSIPRTLWDKIAVTRQLDEEEDSRVPPAEEEVARCQIQNCTFCEHRRGDVVSFDKESQNLQSSASCHEATENPAYGLFAKNWLEIEDEDSEEEVLNATMEPPTTEASSEQNLNTRLLSPNLQQTDLRNSASQQLDGQMNPPMNPPSQNYSNHSIVDTTRHKRADPPKESHSIVESTRHKRSDPSINSDYHKPSSDQKHCGLSWSVLKHRQTDSVENCDKPCVIESGDSRPSSDSRHSQNLPSKMDCSSDTFNKAKRNAKDPRSFPLSLMKPKMASERKSSSNQQQQTSNKTDILRQRPVQRAKLGRISSDVLPNPLSAIEQIKTEESIQEWLARISESVGPEDGERSAWGAKKERQETAKSNKLLRTETTNVLNKGLQEALEMSHHGKQQPDSCHQEDEEEEESSGGSDMLLCNASKASPANVPMVVMQCSRLHPHIGSKPPFQQKSLPMGTLVTALYQESDWMYVQTPHGVEGFIVAANCSPIGTVANNSDANSSAPTTIQQTSRKAPWEPGDFPIEIGAKMHAKVPANHPRRQQSCVSAVKMKTHFYSDRYFGHTAAFKSKDSIKTARTVTDILRNSPETKISSNQ